MTLWDLLETAQCSQIFAIYVQNIYDQNIPLARGTRSEVITVDADYGEKVLFEHLMDKVEYYAVNKNSVIVVFLRDLNYNNKVEKQYSDKVARKWKDLDPNTRPWLYEIETEKYTDEYISKFPPLKK